MEGGEYGVDHHHQAKARLTARVGAGAGRENEGMHAGKLHPAGRVVQRMRKEGRRVRDESGSSRTRHPSSRTRHPASSRTRCLAMTSRWISDVPSPISQILASRIMRSTG